MPWRLNVSTRYTERLTDADIEPPVGGVGASYDNALADTVTRWFKTKVLFRGAQWRYLEAVDFVTLEWVDRFNYRRRLLGPIGNMPPAEREALN